MRLYREIINAFMGLALSEGRSSVGPHGPKWEGSYGASRAMHASIGRRKLSSTGKWGARLCRTSGAGEEAKGCSCTSMPRRIGLVE